MNFKLFLKEKAITILLLLFSIITIEIFLMAYNVGMFIKIYIPLIIMGLYVVSIAIEYFKKKKILWQSIKHAGRVRRKIFNYRNYKYSWFFRRENIKEHNRSNW